MPSCLVVQLQEAFAEAQSFVVSIERLRSAQQGRTKEITTNKARFAYELAYLKIFAAWEHFLEETFIRYLCAHAHSGGPETIKPPHSYCGTIAAAEVMVLGGQLYKLWHNPSHVIARSQTYFINGRHEIVLNSVLSRVESFAAVRHHIAHQKKDTASKFDQACVTLCGHRIAGSRPGTFLRSFVPHLMPQKRWLDLIVSELEAYAAQIVA